MIRPRHSHGSTSTVTEETPNLTRLRRVLLASALLLLPAATLPAAAQAAPEGTGWAAFSSAFPTNLPPSGAGQIQLDILNTGATPSTGTVTVTDKLPAGLTATKAGGMTTNNSSVLDKTEEEKDLGEYHWACTGAGTREITCTSNPAILPHIPFFPAGAAAEPEVVRVGIEVAVAPGSGDEGTSQNEVTVKSAAAAAKSTDPITISSSPPGLGFSGWDLWLTDAKGQADTEAGSHPYEMNIIYGLNELAERVGGTRLAGGEDRNLEPVLPPGFFGNLSKIPRCTRHELDGPKPNGLVCPLDTIIGMENAGLSYEGGGGTSAFTPLAVYNMVPPPGVPAEFAFSIAGIHVFFDAQLRAEGGYTLVEHIRNVPRVELDTNLLTLWGVPAEASHNPERGPFGFCEEVQGVEHGCPSTLKPTPFLTLPSSCAGPQPFTIRALGGWQNPAAEAEASVLTHDNEGNPEGFTECASLEFSPTIEARPTTDAADSATGLHVDLHLPKAGLEEPEGREEANLKNTVVTLPKGMAVNPAGANGLAGCSSAQIGLTSAPGAAKAEYTSAPPSCPQASKIGTVEVDTPLLAEHNEAGQVTGPHPLSGSVYIASQTDNPFKSLLAIYIVIDDPQSGVIVKIAGDVKPDPTTGQLKTSFEENPELPFEDFKVDFFGGAAATLTTPPTCGPYTTTTDLTPWSTPEGADATPSDSFEITQGANGSPSCPRTAAKEPNQPAFSAGTLAPKAGAYSPFLLHLAREDGSQPIKGINTVLPPGLTGKLAGIAECSEAQLALAKGREALGRGAEEIQSPSCPLDSEVGKVTVGAGAGPDPIYVSGHAYLAGPYKGAPLSLAIITPAVAGPFDLGAVVVRTALYVNPETAQISAKSDEIPTVRDGIPLEVRSIALSMDRPEFTLNPTSCGKLPLSGEAISALNQIAPLSDPFQVGECAKLGFAPKLALSLKGGTKRASHPALKAVVTYPAKGAYSNIARAQVTLPHSEFLDNAHIGTVCTKVVFAEGSNLGEKCPAASVYGFAKAETPLLEKPLEGPVYLRSPLPGHKLPDLVAALNGQIGVALVGKVDTGKGGGIRNTFEVVPDAPVTKFTLSMQGGGKGLLENSENICSHPQKAIADFTAQNGKVDDYSPLIGNSCKGKKHRKGGGKHHHRGGKR